MQTGGSCYAASSRCTVEEADLHEIRLNNVLDGHGLLAYGSGQCFQSYRAAAVVSILLSFESSPSSSISRRSSAVCAVSRVMTPFDIT